MSLGDLIQRRPAVNRSATVEAAVKVMTDNEIGAIAVMEGSRIVGIFTERDLMRRVVFQRKDLAATAIGDVMSSPVLTISASSSVEQAARLMRLHNIRHLAVVDDRGDLLGVVALRYLLFDLMGDLERKVDDLQGFVMADGPGG
jgi:CBS domain-containing protein